MNGATNSQMMLTVITRLFPFCVPMMVWHTSFSLTTCGQDIPAFVDLPQFRKLTSHHQQTFSTAGLGTPGKSTVFWAVHVREGSLSQLKSDWLDMAKADPVSTSDCPWGHNQFTSGSSSVFMEDLLCIWAVRDWIQWWTRQIKILHGLSLCCTPEANTTL